MVSNYRCSLTSAMPKHKSLSTIKYSLQILFKEECVIAPIPEPPIVCRKKIFANTLSMNARFQMNSAIVAGSVMIKRYKDNHGQSSEHLRITAEVSNMLLHSCVSWQYAISPVAAIWWPEYPSIISRDYWCLYSDEFNSHLLWHLRVEG